MKNLINTEAFSNAAAKDLGIKPFYSKTNKLMNKLFEE